MTLLREIQGLLERTYGSTGVNFEEFLFSRAASDALVLQADAALGEIAALGRVTLRRVRDQLRIGLHYHPQIIAALEQHDPRHALTDHNVLPLLVLVEELDHAVHAALKFRRGQRQIHAESFLADLELQAQVDTYFVLLRFCEMTNQPPGITEADRRWLRACVFDSRACRYADARLTERYRTANRLARRFVRCIERLPPAARTRALRRFARSSYAQKCATIAALRE